MLRLFEKEREKKEAREKKRTFKRKLFDLFGIEFIVAYRNVEDNEDAFFTTTLITLRVLHFELEIDDASQNEVENTDGSNIIREPV